MKTNIGGDRLGSGNKESVAMKNYTRSTHDLGYVWRSSMASGTLVPFLSEVGLPGDRFDIDLTADVKTLPTVGPLFGSYKVQMDVFSCPIRLYQGKLHMNMLNIGLDMGEVLLPQMQLEGLYVDGEDNEQINSSSILSYLNIRGLGRNKAGETGVIKRKFNALSYLGYWDIYKNYYANKSEERGFVIHNNGVTNDFDVDVCKVRTIDGATVREFDINGITTNITTAANMSVSLIMQLTQIGNAGDGRPNVQSIVVTIDGVTNTLGNFFTNVTAVNSGQPGEWRVRATGYRGSYGQQAWAYSGNPVQNTIQQGQGIPQLTEFPLENIDDMRMDILEAVRQTSAFMLDGSSQAPYGLSLGNTGGEEDAYFYAKSSQEGLGIKTYQSDLFNNWINTEWIDGTNGISEITSIDTSGGAFTIDALNLANKVYNMLNRIAISGSDYDSWLSAVYTHERAKGHENPIYMGSLIKELAFEEVISQSDVTDPTGNSQPLGTLAGRGRLTGKHKGGKIKVKVDEPSIILGIVSLTPRTDYSQGNKYDVNLKSMNDFYKPELGQIGYQDLVTDQMAWFSTEVSQSEVVTFTSAGKQPAWINYMTNVNQCRGHFAEKNNSMFMTLNRRYESGIDGIDDLTTYIDPSKYNNIFAQTSLDSQNFWVQIGIDMIARRKMSAKVIPNL